MVNMNKKISILAASVLSLSLLAACSPADATTTAADKGTQTTTTTAETGTKTEASNEVEGPKAAEAGSIVKLGLGTKTSVAKSAEFTADKAGSAQADVVIAAVGFDKDNKVASIKIDNAQTKVEFNEDGSLKSDPAAEYNTKQEKGADYGLIKASAIGREWNQQIEALSAWMQGKTVEEIKAIKLTETGNPDEADLATSVSISVPDYIAVVEEAFQNAVEVAEGADEVGLGVEISIVKSAGKTDDKGAVAQVDTTLSAVALKGEKVAASILDVVQAPVVYDADGMITSDIVAEVPSKNELGEDYGMIKASTIGKEWFEQAQALADWTVNKTAAEIQDIPAEDKDGKIVVTDADLATSVSVGIGDYLTVFEEAIETAR